MRSREEEITRFHFPKLFNLKEDFDISFNICMADIWACHQLSLNQPENETWRRLVIRTIFTSLDLFCRDLNQTSMEFHKEFVKYLSQEDLLFLQGKKINKAGEQKDNQTRFGEYFTNTIRIYAAVQGKKCLPAKGREWQQFIKAIAIRNRITHPHRSADLHIALSEYQESIAGCLWAIGCLRELFAGLVKK